MSSLPAGIQTTAQLQAHYAAVRERLIGKPQPPKRIAGPWRPMQGPPCPHLLYAVDEGDWRYWSNRVTVRTGFTYADMRSSRQGRGLAEARFEAFYLIRNNVDNAARLPIAWGRIGKLFGDRDHSTVHHGAYKWAERNGLEKPR